MKSMRDSSPDRVNWASERDRVDLAAIASRLLGPAPGRRGGGRKLWWSCPLGTHEDANPSFAVAPGNPRWKCWGCGESGDAATLVMKVNGLRFPDAIRFILNGSTAPATRGIAAKASPRIAPAPPPSEPKGMPLGEVVVLIEASEVRLWTDEGERARRYLSISRGLSDETIRAARLGVTSPLDLPGRPKGIVLAWWEGGRPTLVKLRQPEPLRPRYRELFRRAPRLFFGNGPVVAGLPLVIVEGEFDALLLGQELDGLAKVATLGGASSRPEAATFGPLLAAFPWFIATDADSAGDKAAEGWPRCARRIRPPGAFKDWTEMHAARINLRDWWSGILAGDEPRPLTAWHEVQGLRWGPAVGDPEPGEDVGECLPLPEL